MVYICHGILLNNKKEQFTDTRDFGEPIRNYAESKLFRKITYSMVQFDKHNICRNGTQASGFQG